MTLDEHMERLAKARKRLDEPQGRIARRNARQRFLKVLRQVRAAVDEEYPVIQKKITKRKRKRRSGRLKGVTRITAEEHRQLLMAGVSTNQFTVVGKSAHAPTWMVKCMKAGFKLSDIKAAVRSTKQRKKMLMMVKLGAKR